MDTVWYGSSCSYSIEWRMRERKKATSHSMEKKLHTLIQNWVLIWIKFKSSEGCFAFINMNHWFEMFKTRSTTSIFKMILVNQLALVSSADDVKHVCFTFGWMSNCFHNTRIDTTKMVGVDFYFTLSLWFLFMKFEFHLIVLLIPKWTSHYLLLTKNYKRPNNHLKKKNFFGTHGIIKKCITLLCAKDKIKADIIEHT